MKMKRKTLTDLLNAAFQNAKERKLKEKQAKANKVVSSKTVTNKTKTTSTKPAVTKKTVASKTVTKPVVKKATPKPIAKPAPTPVKATPAPAKVKVKKEVLQQAVQTIDPLETHETYADVKRAIWAKIPKVYGSGNPNAHRYDELRVFYEEKFKKIMLNYVLLEKAFSSASKSGFSDVNEYDIRADTSFHDIPVLIRLVMEDISDGDYCFPRSDVQFSFKNKKEFIETVKKLADKFFADVKKICNDKTIEIELKNSRCPDGIRALYQLIATLPRAEKEIETWLK